jgi:hypothetical protein
MDDFSKVVEFAAWLTGIIVSLAVGFGMIEGSLTIPWLNNLWGIPIVAGWIVIVLTILGVVFAIADRF